MVADITLGSMLLVIGGLTIYAGTCWAEDDIKQFFLFGAILACLMQLEVLFLNDLYPLLYPAVI